MRILRIALGVVTAPSLVGVARRERHWFERLRSHPEIEIVRHDADPLG